MEKESPKRKSSECSQFRKEGEKVRNRGRTITRLKTKREPLPMKMRAFPLSFWQQPNSSGSVLPTNHCSPLEEERERNSHGQVVGKANTDLLFSLFQSIGEEDDQPKRVPIVRRGRPRKVKAQHETAKTAKDDDPYFTSAIIPAIQMKEEDKVAQKQQVLAMISIPGENKNFPLDTSYLERLSDLVVNL